jgi:pyruvate/oxaloacetate carboxyltransferase
MLSTYNILTGTEKNFDNNTKRLLMGDFVTQPSIINKQLEEKIRQEFFALQ